MFHKRNAQSLREICKNIFQYLHKYKYGLKNIYEMLTDF